MVDEGDEKRRFVVGPLPEGYFQMTDEEAEEHDLAIGEKIFRQLGIEPNA